MSITKFALPWPAYACDWSSADPLSDGADPFALVALASFMPRKRNELLILAQEGDGGELRAICGPIAYKMAATKALFCPARRGNRNILALAGADICLYSIQDRTIEHVSTLSSASALKRNSIASDGVLIPESGKNGSSSSNRHANSPAPITSVAWSLTDPNLLLSASYDTTCTIWNVECCSIMTQLIAHDKEVFDVAFSPVRSDSFVSVGAEGSLRLFDCRNLEHSTILFETKDASPLVRVAWNPNDVRYIACFGLHTADVNIIDTRAPAVPIATLEGHANVSCVKWAPHSSGHIMTADDHMVALWDLSRSTAQPSRCYDPGAPAQQLLWPAHHADHRSLRDRHLVGILADADMITGMLLAGIGSADGTGHAGPNYHVVDGKASTAAVEEAFGKLVARRDIAVLIITQPVADRIRHLVDDYQQLLPALLEVPSKDSTYDMDKDSLLRRINRLCGHE